MGEALLYKHLFAINDVDTFCGLLQTTTIEVIYSFHISAFTFHLNNTGCCLDIKDSQCRAGIMATIPKSQLIVAVVYLV